jgi:OPA family glycerol-3-phosphate transporter-like MFS transporter
MGLSYVRELDEYPTGLHRIWLLAMAVLAILIGSYEAQIAPVVPLLERDLHMSLATYGLVSSVALLAGGLAAMVAGRLTDHYGRVRLLSPCILLTGVCCFAMTLVHTPTHLLLVRIVLCVVDGVAIAGTAPLIRDYAPRTGRAQSYGFWTWGPVGANFLAAAIAGLTLPLFVNSWRSQFVIMGVISILVSLLIVSNIADLSPELRSRIRRTEHHELGRADQSTPSQARMLFAHRNIWAHAIGISLWLVLYLSLMLYGPTMISESFHLDAATASAIMAVFWVLNLVTLVVVGRISDRLQLRKPISVAGTLAALALGCYLVGLIGEGTVSPAHLMITGALLGGALGVGYCPWMANFSEDAEDIEPRLQGAAWGIYGLLSKVMAVLVLIFVPVVVAASSWSTWLIVANVCLALFIPAAVMFRGPWRRGSTVMRPGQPVRPSS